MINNTMLLFKIQLLSLFDLNKSRYTKDPKEKRKARILTIVAVPILLILLGYSFGLFYAYAYMGLADILPSFALVICSIVVLFTTILKSNGVLFNAKDYDMIMSLPVNTASIACSRFLTMYVLNLLFCCFVFIPASIVYVIFLHPPILIDVMLLLSLFATPLFPMALASMIGCLITLLSLRFRHKTLISTILSIGLTFLIIFYSLQFGNMNTAKFSAVNATILHSIYKLYPVSKLYQDAISEVNITTFFLFLLLSFGTFLLFVALVSHFYTQIHTQLFSHQTKANYKLTAQKSSSPLAALYKKELKRYFSSTNYVLNTSIGILMLLFLSAAIFVLGPDHILSLMKLSKNQITFPYIKIIPLIMVSFVLLCSTTTSSISLEGKNFWILSSIPVEQKTIYFSKIAVNLTIFLPGVFLSGILLAIRLQTSSIETLLMLLLPTVYTFFISQTGLLINLKFYNFQWTNEITVIKQSAALLLTMLTGFFVMLLSAAMLFLFHLENATYTYLALSALIALITYLLNRITNKQTIYLE